MRKKKYRVLDLFCGAGGLSLGFEISNRFRVVGAIDNWKYACETFRHNHPNLANRKVLCSDLSEAIGENSAEYLAALPYKKDDIEVILGGPPCQGMSLAGKRLNNDPRNMLFLAFVRFVDYFQPKMFVMENVPGLLTSNGGAIRNAILREFNEIGYKFISHDHPTLLKAETYGVPQFRRRVFFVGFREDATFSDPVWPPVATHQDYESYQKKDPSQRMFDFPGSSELLAPISVKEAIDDLPIINSGEGSDEADYPKKPNTLSDFQKFARDWQQCPDKDRVAKVYNHQASKHTEALIKMIKSTSPGTSVDPKYADSRKWDPDLPSQTVKALGAGGGSTNRRAFHYDNARGSTIRENARVQSFPDWYRFMGAKTHQMSQVGNAVPPLLAKAIALTLADILDDTKS